MACDPQTLLAQAECIRCGIPPGALGAVNISLLCQLVSGVATGPYVFKAGDTMTGPLVLPNIQTALKLGGTGAGSPALGVSAGLAQFRLADNSNWAVLQSGFTQANVSDANSNTQPVAAELYHETTGGAGGGAVNGGVSLDFRADSATVDRQQAIRLQSLWTDATQATLTSQMRVLPLLNAVATEALRISNSQIDARNNAVFAVAGTQVVGPQNTGWSTFTGASTKNASAFDTGSVTTAQLAQVVKAMLDALITHGLLHA